MLFSESLVLFMHNRLSQEEQQNSNMGVNNFFFISDLSVNSTLEVQSMSTWQVSDLQISDGQLVTH